MPDELDLENLDKEIEGTSKVEKRIKDLSEKVRLTAEERDERDKLLTTEREKSESLTKENQFLNSFGDSLAKYPNASGYKDEIKEKVLKGYSVEDATISTLASKGQFTQGQQEKVAPTTNPAGGSAAVNVPTGDKKKVDEMNRQEKRDALLEAEKRGDVYVS